MVTLDTSFKRLNKLTGRKLSIKQLEDTLIDMGFELDDIQGDDIKIDITPDRPDCVSVQGMARALRQYLSIEKGLKKYEARKSDYELIIHDSLRKIRPYAVSCVIKGINFTEELIKEVIWVQEKLHATYGRDRKKAAIGIYSFEGVKPPIHFMAKEPEKIRFIPLEFKEEMNAKEILKKHPTGIKYSKLLEGFKKYPVLIDSANNVLSMPPIINSQTYGKITPETKDIFMEVTGTHFLTVNQVLSILATMFAEAGGRIISMKVKYPDNKKYITPVLNPEKRKLKLDNVNSLIGVKFRLNEVKDLLMRMGYGIKLMNKDLQVEIPCYRTDVLHDVDLIDDVARAYGFNNLEPEFPQTPSIGGLLDRTYFINRVRELMIGLGLLEVFTLAFSTVNDQFKKMRIPVKKHVSVVSSRSKYDIIRTSMLPSILGCFSNNLHDDYPQKIFEINDVVILDDDKDVKSRNETRLCVGLIHSKANFTEIKQVLEALFSNLKKEYKLSESVHPSFIKGRCAEIMYNNKKIGIIGEAHPEVITNFGMELPLTMLELNIEALF